MVSIADDRQRRRQACSKVLPGFRVLPPAEEFRLLAAWCEANDVVHDVYGDGRLVMEFEQKIAALLGKDSAVFMPSGTMAQLAAIRIWTLRAGLDRVGMHPTSHLLLHEREAYQALFRFHGAPVGDRLRPLAARDLTTEAQPLACLLVELPIREAGGQLPTWSELEALKSASRERGVHLHMDGARLWESRAFYGRSYAEIADGFGSVYVSMYKGLGGLAGALLAGDTGFIAEARLWQRRLGGNLINQTALVASAAMRLDQRLALMAACYDRARELAQGLAAVAGVRVNPELPHTNMMHVFFDAPAETIVRRRDEIATQNGVWVVNEPRDTAVPGWCVTELYVGDTLLELSNGEAIPLFERLIA